MLNFRLSSVPEPDSSVIPNAEITRLPGEDEFAKTSIPLLRVPAESTAVVCGCTTAGSKLIVASYEITPRPVRSLILNGTVIASPGVPVSEPGSEAETQTGGWITWRHCENSEVFPA